MTGGQVYRLPLLSAEEWTDKKLFSDQIKRDQRGRMKRSLFRKGRLREKILTQVWTSHVKGEFDFDQFDRDRGSIFIRHCGCG